MSKSKKVVKFNISLELLVSEEYLEKLQSQEAKWAVFDNCFRNNLRRNVNATMEVLQDETVSN